jgi:hypothetical protein
MILFRELKCPICLATRFVKLHFRVKDQDDVSEGSAEVWCPDCLSTSVYRLFVDISYDDSHFHFKIPECLEEIFETHGKVDVDNNSLTVTLDTGKILTLNDADFPESTHSDVLSKWVRFVRLHEILPYTLQF